MSSVEKPEARINLQDEEIGRIRHSKDEPEDELILGNFSHDSGRMKRATPLLAGMDSTAEGDRSNVQSSALGRKPLEVGSLMLLSSNLTEKSCESISPGKAKLDSKSDENKSPKSQSCRLKTRMRSPSSMPKSSSEVEGSDKFSPKSKSGRKILQEILLNRDEGNGWTSNLGHAGSKGGAIIEGSMNKPIQIGFNMFGPNNAEMQMNWPRRNLALHNDSKERVPCALSKEVVESNDCVASAEINEIAESSMAEIKQVFNEIYYEDTQRSPSELRRLHIADDSIGTAATSDVLDAAAAKLNEIVKVAMAKIKSTVNFEDSDEESTFTDDNLPWSDLVYHNEPNPGVIGRRRVFCENYAAATEMNDIMKVGAINLDVPNRQELTLDEMNEVGSSVVEGASVCIYSSSFQDGNKSENHG